MDTARGLVQPFVHAHKAAGEGEVARKRLRLAPLQQDGQMTLHHGHQDEVNGHGKRRMGHGAILIS